jgi:hypothetical protein
VGIRNIIFITMVVFVVLIVPLLPEIVYLIWRRSKGRTNSIKIVDVLLLLLGIVFGLAFYFVVSRM